MSTSGAEPRIAIVHDELTRRGGAETVLEDLVRLYPSADIFALYTGRPQITVDEKTYPVKTSYLQKMPRWFRQHPKRLLPLLPYAAEQLDLSDYDLVLSSASGFAKAVVTRANVPHVCYCHTPTRYLWDDTHLTVTQAPRGQKFIGRTIMHALRLTDYAAAQRVDHFIANSNWTKQRINKYYRRDSDVVYPAVDTAFFTPLETGRAFGLPAGQAGTSASSQGAGSLTGSPPAKNYFLCVGRLTPSKKFEHAIAACEKLQLPLIIVGKGHHEKALKKRAGPHTRFVGKVGREELRTYYRQARALLQPGMEDFGIAAVEAQACGTPVIAYGAGGVQETIRHNETGYLYHDQRIEALAETLRQFLAAPPLAGEDMQRHAFRFSAAAFRTGIRVQVEKMLGERVNQAAY